MAVEDFVGAQSPLSSPRPSLSSPSAASASSGGFPLSPSSSSAVPSSSASSSSSSSSSLFPGSSASWSVREREYVLREERKLRGVQEAMVRCAELTEAMVDLLDALDRKLHTLEHAMLPVHRGTEGLIAAQKSRRSGGRSRRAAPQPLPSHCSHPAPMPVPVPVTVCCLSSLLAVRPGRYAE